MKIFLVEQGANTTIVNSGSVISPQLRSFLVRINL